MEGRVVRHRAEVDEEVISIYNKGDRKPRPSSIISIDKGTSDNAVESDLV
jgi:hypothetical protein